jgi:hypothetical protein
MVPFWVDPNDPVSVVANGLALAISGSDGLASEDAVKYWPQDIPLLSADLDSFAKWIAKVAERWRERYPKGNDAALQAAE